MKNDFDPLFQINGKKILLAGACGGIGLPISKFLYERGTQLILLDQNEEKLSELAQKFPGSAFFTVDICNESQVHDLFSKIKKMNGGIDGLINSAGVFSMEPSLDINLQHFRQCIDINLSGALTLSQLAARLMARDGGRIIHLASVSSKVANAEYASYSSSKAALAQLVKVLAREWAKKEILVNAIGPAMIEGEMSKEILKDPAFREQVLGAIPMSRFCHPSDLFGVILLLLSRAGEFITGQTIYVDGGRTLV